MEGWMKGLAKDSGHSWMGDREEHTVLTRSMRESLLELGLGLRPQSL